MLFEEETELRIDNFRSKLKKTIWIIGISSIQAKQRKCRCALFSWSVMDREMDRVSQG
jgi:hypothetical protein